MEIYDIQLLTCTITHLQTLRPGVKLTLGMNVDTKTMATEAQKLGLALTINA